jgi:chromosome segregation protein
LRLASLTLHGFKSFGDRTSVEIAPGVTALIGPNGSGKSNLIDALKWATGGGRASTYRAGDKRELIFHGADGKRAVSIAEVEVEFEDGDRSLKIARTLDRDGVARLKLNGRNARLLDVDDALAGSGLGRAGVSVIGQGEVGQVLMADPVKLLSYVSEAAGVSKLSGRRDLSAARLDTARQHLERLGDVLLELELQLDRLEREAGQAARHAALSREQLLLRYTVAAGRRDGLRAEIRKLLARQIALSERLEAGRGELQQREEAQQSARAALRIGEDDFREAQALSERRRAEVRVAEVRLAGAEQRWTALEQQRSGVLLELAQLAELDAPAPPAGDLGLVQRLEIETEAAFAALQSDLAVAEARLGERRVALETSAAAETARLERSAYDRARRDELESQRSRLAGALDASRNAPVPDLAAVDAEAERLGRESAEADRAATAAQLGLEEAHAAHAAAAAEAQALARAHERQRSAHEARRSYAHGPRTALTSGLRGIVGSVADLIVVPETLQTALASTLGRRAESVVIERADHADAVIEHVRRAKGWVTLIPLDLLSERTPPAKRWREASGVVGVANALVDYEPRYRALVDQLLGGVVVVETFDDGLALARAGGRRPRLVTLEGTLFEPGGAVSGGRPLQRSSVFGAPAELAEAERASLDAAGDERAAHEHLDLMRSAQQSARSAANRLAEGWREADERRRAQHGAAGERSVRLADLEARLAALDTEIGRLPAADEGVAAADLLVANGMEPLDRACFLRASCAVTSRRWIATQPSSDARSR